MTGFTADLSRKALRMTLASASVGSSSFRSEEIFLSDVPLITWQHFLRISHYNSNLKFGQNFIE